MMGSFITRTLALALGYAYPAYECFKTVERNKPEIEQLRFWCQYWILVAALTIFERVGDTFISWLPMYSEAKLAFFVYLWYPKTRGTTYVYETFFQPYVARHESEIDRNLLELRTRAGDTAILYWQRAAAYGQTRFFEMLQFVASQSQPPRPRPVQQRQQQQGRQPPPIVPSRQSVTQQPQEPNPRQPPTPVKSKILEPVQEAGPAAQIASVPVQTATADPSLPAAETAGPFKMKEAEATQVKVTSVSSSQEQSIPAKENLMDETIRMTRARLRKTASTGSTTPTR